MPEISQIVGLTHARIEGFSLGRCSSSGAMSLVVAHRALVAGGCELAGEAGTRPQPIDH